MVAGFRRYGAEGFFLRQSEAVNDQTFTPQDRSVEAGSDVRTFGAFTTGQPIEIRNVPGDGAVRQSFFEDYYNRIHFIPSVINFGPVAADVTRRFDLWNAWFKKVKLESITEIETDGTALDTDLTFLPVTYRPLALIEYDAIAFLDGPPKFEATYTFAFDTDERVDLTLTGERSRVLPLRPNWRESYTVELEYKTDVWTSRSGREQRRALRQTPRKTINFKASALRPDELRAFNRHMNIWQARTAVIPCEVQYAVTSAAILAGNTAFPLTSVPSWIQIGAPVFIEKQDRSERLVTQVASIVGSTVELEGVISFDMPAGSFIKHGQYGFLRDEMSSSRKTNFVAETDVSFDVTPGSELPLPTFEVGPDLDGRPVFDLRANWSKAPDVTYIRPRETLDYGFGLIQITTPIEFSSRSTQYLFSGRSAADMGRIENLFRAMRGRQGEFWYPSWENDLVMSRDAVEGTFTLEFDGDDVFNNYAGDTVHRAIALRLPNKQLVVNRMVEDVVFSEGKTVMTLAEAWPETYPKSTPISWLYLCRFSGDKLALEWETRTVGKCQATFLTLEALPNG